MLAVRDLGLVAYEEAHRAQLRALEERVSGRGPDTLFLLEHPPVITLGRGTDPRNLGPLSEIPRVSCERGGDVTLHLPGQVVGYLVRYLEPGQRDLHAHLRLLEEIVMRTLQRIGIPSRREPGATGVWTATGKIASLGAACRRWCTWHGFALNVACKLSLFQHIRPCGFEASVMTSVEREHPPAPSLGEVKRLLGEEAQSLLAAASVDPATPGA